MYSDDDLHYKRLFMQFQYLLLFHLMITLTRLEGSNQLFFNFSISVYDQCKIASSSDLCVPSTSHNIPTFSFTTTNWNSSGNQFRGDHGNVHNRN